MSLIISPKSFSQTYSSQAVNQNAASFTTTISPPITLKGNYRVAVSQYAIWRSQVNISLNLNNNSLSYEISTDPGNPHTITIPDGLYFIEQLNQTIGDLLVANNDVPTDGTVTAQGITITPLDQYGTTQVNLVQDSSFSPTFTSVTFDAGLSNLLGFQFSDMPLTDPINQGTVYANLSNGFTSFIITASIANQTWQYVNGRPSQALYTDSWAVGPYFLQNTKPNPFVFAPVGSGTIDSLTIEFKDQVGNLIDFHQTNNGVTNYKVNDSVVTLYFERVD